MPLILRKILRDASEGKLKWPLYLWSETAGVGKSCACLCICDLVADSEFWPFPAFCDRWREIHNAGEIFEEVEGEMQPGNWRLPGRTIRWTPQNFWRFFSSRPLVVIDEIGLGEPTQFKQEALWRLLESRVSMPLILTSNKAPDKHGLGKLFDARIISRIGEAGSVFEIQGESLR